MAILSFSKINHLVRMMRPENMRFGVLVMIIASVKTHQPLLHTALSAILLLLLYGVVTAYNDIKDFEIDRQNRRQLPLVSGTVNIREAKILILGLIIGIVLLQIGVSQPIGIVISVAFLSLGWAYSSPPLKVENRGLMATLLLTICYTILPLLLGFKYLSIEAYGLLTSAVFLSVPTLLLKDLKDVNGDKAHGKLTPFIRYGIKKIKQFSLLSLVLGAGLIILIAPNPLTITFALLGTLWSTQLLKPPSPSNLNIYYIKLAASLVFISAMVTF